MPRVRLGLLQWEGLQVLTLRLVSPPSSAPSALHLSACLSGVAAGSGGRGAGHVGEMSVKAMRLATARMCHLEYQEHKALLVSSPTTQALYRA